MLKLPKTDYPVVDFFVHICNQLNHNMKEIAIGANSGDNVTAMPYSIGISTCYENDLRSPVPIFYGELQTLESSANPDVVDMDMGKILHQFPHDEYASHAAIPSTEPNSRFCKSEHWDDIHLEAVLWISEQVSRRIEILKKQHKAYKNLHARFWVSHSICRVDRYDVSLSQYQDNDTNVRSRLHDQMNELSSLIHYNAMTDVINVETLANYRSGETMIADPAIKTDSNDFKNAIRHLNHSWTKFKEAYCLSRIASKEGVLSFRRSAIYRSFRSQLILKYLVFAE